MRFTLPEIVMGFALTQAACNVISLDLLGTSDAAAPPTEASIPGVDALQENPEPGLILRYSFEDSGSIASDSSGRKKDGAVYRQGAVRPDAAADNAWTPDGRIGRGLALAGAEYVSLPNGVLEGVDEFTIATWVKLRSTANWARIYDFGNAPNDQFMYLTIAGYQPPLTTIPDGIHASSFAGGTTENWLGTGRPDKMTALPTLVWKHLVVTGTSGDRRIYIDGFPVAVRTGGPNIPPRVMEPMAPNSWLGRSRYNDAQPPDPKLNGTLDEFRIYNRVLTPAEIAELAKPQRDYSYWRFDEASGTSAKDSSENDIMATGTGVSWTTGRLGGAVRLDGAPPQTIGPHIALAKSPLAGCAEFTVSVWVNPEVIDSSRVFDFGTGANDYIYLALNEGTGVHFGMAATGKTTYGLSTPSGVLTEKSWHHLGVTLLSGTANIYVDGVLQASAPNATIKPSDLGATTENWIGRSRVSSHRSLTGAIDELRVSCRAYTADEMYFLSRP